MGEAHGHALILPDGVLLITKNETMNFTVYSLVNLCLRNGRKNYNDRHK